MALITLAERYDTSQGEVSSYWLVIESFTQILAVSGERKNEDASLLDG